MRSIMVLSGEQERVNGRRGNLHRPRDSLCPLSLSLSVWCCSRVCVASVRRCKEFELITPLLVLLLLLLLKLQLQLLLLLLQLMMVSLSLSLLVLHERQASPGKARQFAN